MHLSRHYWGFLALALPLLAPIASFAQFRPDFGGQMGPGAAGPGGRGEFGRGEGRRGEGREGRGEFGRGEGREGRGEFSRGEFGRSGEGRGPGGEGRGEFGRGGEGREGRGEFGRGGEGRGGEGRGEEGRGRFDPTSFLSRLDANQDGFLQPEEISERSRPFVQRFAERAGMDLNSPISLKKLAKRLEDGSDHTEGSDSSRSSSGKSGDKSGTASLVPGFGNDGSAAAVPGFDIPGAAAKLAAGKKGSSSSKSGKSSTSSTDAEALERNKKYAQSLLAQYDKNKNGVLEKDEWSEMRGDMKTSDTNNDDLISLDELAVRLAAFSKQNSGGGEIARPAGSSDSGSYIVLGIEQPGNKKAYKVTAPVDRLPKGLPAWFSRSDLDADGQVSLAEYTPTPDNAKIAEFNHYDQNGDGFVTAPECLIGEKTPRVETAVADSSSSRSESSSSKLGSRPSGSYGGAPSGSGSSGTPSTGSRSSGNRPGGSTTSSGRSGESRPSFGGFQRRER